ncbi:hypothetical protein [Streptomyces sp. NPDC048187]|uniref:hypothetical protein n=1 Tax=Streptomyces sp. NPDC048187 TaxID=3365509 RepID=UPI0037186657
MVERERLMDAASDRNRRFRVRDGVGLVLFVVVGAAVLVGMVAGSRWAARESAPVLYDLLGGSWGVGGVLGLVTLLGWGGALSGRLASGVLLRRAARGACCAAAVAPVFFLISGLQGKNCRSYEPACSYVPGTGPALLVYVGCVAVVGWLTYRRRRAVLEQRRAREQERLRRLRNKGKGKSRRAASER